jgi:hypothetical protein
VAGYALAGSLGLPLTLGESLTLIPPVVLATTLPLSIGGWGIREAGMVGMLGMVGIPRAGALVLSVQLGLLSVLMSLPAGVLWLLYRKRARHRDAPIIRG